MNLAEVLRPCVPQVVATLMRRGAHFAEAEDATQEALLAAFQQWDAPPENPRAWLVTVASRRLTDQFRADDARRRREVSAFLLDPGADLGSDSGPAARGDDELLLLMLCCDPALSADSQVALTLRAVAGLTTAQIAQAYLVPEATMTRRISRAKQRLRSAGWPPVRAETASAESTVLASADSRLAGVRHTLYLMFNEGYAGRGELADEAIRLTRQLHARCPDDAEVTGLLALMLLTDARRAGRMTEDGRLVALAEQDRSLWSAPLIAEGRALLEDLLPRSLVGPYQVQAAIAAVHDDAQRSEDTDWPQIAELYRLLDQLAPGPLVTLARAVAVGMADSGADGLAMLIDVSEDTHRLHAVRGHLLELCGEPVSAAHEYRLAARMSTSSSEKRWLEAQVDRLRSPT